MDDIPSGTGHDDSSSDENDDQGRWYPSADPWSPPPRPVVPPLSVENLRARASTLAKLGPSDCGWKLALMNAQECARMFAEIKKGNERVRLLGYLHPEKKADVLECMGPAGRANAFLWMSPDDRADMFTQKGPVGGARMLEETLEHMDPNELSQEELLTPTDNPRALANTFSRIGVSQLAQMVGEIDPKVRAQVFASMHPLTKAYTYAYLPQEERGNLLTSVKPEHSAPMFLAMDRPWRNVIFSQMDSKVAPQMEAAILKESERRERESDDERLHTSYSVRAPGDTTWRLGGKLGLKQAGPSFSGRGQQLGSEVEQAPDTPAPNSSGSALPAKNQARQKRRDQALVQATARAAERGGRSEGSRGAESESGAESDDNSDYLSCDPDMDMSR
jgi:hypothetical protein